MRPRNEPPLSPAAGGHLARPADPADHYRGWSAEEIAADVALREAHDRIREPIAFSGLSAPALTGQGIEHMISAVNRAYCRGLRINLNGRY